MRLAKDDSMAAFEARGGVMDGRRLSPEQVQGVSKWPSRTEQLSLLVGQILGPGARLVGQLTGPAAALAGQIAQEAERREGAADESAEGG